MLLPVAVDEPRLGTVWPALREPLLAFTFSDMKLMAGAAGLATEKLSNLRQTSSGRQSTSKAELADGIDGLFDRLEPATKDRVAAHLINELLRRRPGDTERLEELLERRGWTLLGDQPVPLQLRMDAVPETLSSVAQKGLEKALRRHRDGDLDGAITSIAGVIDTLTLEIYDRYELRGYKTAGFHGRIVAAYRQLRSEFEASLETMNADARTRTWKAQERAVGGAAEVLAAYRNNYSDAHGPRSGDSKIVQAAMHAAVFLIRSLAD